MYNNRNRRNNNGCSVISAINKACKIRCLNRSDARFLIEDVLYYKVNRNRSLYREVCKLTNTCSQRAIDKDTLAFEIKMAILRA